MCVCCVFVCVCVCVCQLFFPLFPVLLTHIVLTCPYSSGSCLYAGIAFDCLRCNLSKVAISASQCDCHACMQYSLWSLGTHLYNGEINVFLCILYFSSLKLMSRLPSRLLCHIVLKLSNSNSVIFLRLPLFLLYLFL